MGGCTASDTLDIWVDAFDVPLLTMPFDTTVCEGAEFPLATYPFPSMTTQFEWSPSDQLSGNNIPDPIFTAGESTTINLNVTSANQLCEENFEFDITVLENQAEILGDSTYQICLGESVEITRASNPGTFTFNPVEVITDLIDATTVEVTPTESMWFYLTQTEPQAFCNFQDSVYIQVDSLPDMTIEAVPDNNPYCFGEIVSLISPNYDPALFPNIMHQWTPSIGVVDYDDNQNNYNIGIVATETTTYIRQTTNGTCQETESITINVVNPNLSLTVMDTTVCLGESFLLDVISSDNLEEIEWTSSQTLSLSCNDCLNPTITANGNGAATITAEVQGCPISATVNVSIPPPPTSEISGDIQIPLGNEVDLTALIDPLPSSEILWFVEGTSSGSTGMTFMHLPTEEYTDYSIQFMDQFGCTYMDTITIQVLIPKFDFPNVFAPGDTQGDSLNRVFNYVVWLDNNANGQLDSDEVVDDAEYEVSQFGIYNRWGEAVLNCDDRDCAVDGWNGDYKDKAQPLDVYLYIFEATLINGDKIKAKGDLTLLR